MTIKMQADLAQMAIHNYQGRMKMGADSKKEKMSDGKALVEDPVINWDRIPIGVRSITVRSKGLCAEGMYRALFSIYLSDFSIFPQWKNHIGQTFKRSDEVKDITSMDCSSCRELEQQCKLKDSELDRLKKRDCNAGIELVYNDGENPFAREQLSVVDVGVSDNYYVVESQVLKDAQVEIERLRDALNHICWMPCGNEPLAMNIHDYAKRALVGEGES